MKKNPRKRLSVLDRRAIAEFRFAVIGPLLARPPDDPGLNQAVQDLAARRWKVPGHRDTKTISERTIWRWYGLARRAPDRMQALISKRRKDAGVMRVLSDEQKLWLRKNYISHSDWTFELHHKNLVVAIDKPRGSYSTVKKFLKENGLNPKRKSKRHKPKYERRLFEVSAAGILWHVDAHNGSRLVVLPDGHFAEAKCFAIVDDFSRYVCHAQWFTNEGTRELVHLFKQALQRWGLPAGLISDRGSAMIAHEFAEGLSRLAITKHETPPYSPEDNGNQEAFWNPLEGQLMKMLPKKPLTLDELNVATLSWVEQEFNRRVHRETKEVPRTRLLEGRTVLRPAPASKVLENAFRITETRCPRRSDGTVSIQGIRLEIPYSMRHLDRIVVRFARWDLSKAEIADRDTGESLFEIQPVNQRANASRHRRPLPDEPVPVMPDDESEHEPAPLLKRCIDRQSICGVPWIPLPSKGDNSED